MQKYKATDGYKVCHMQQYPKTILSMYGNLTARSDKNLKQRSSVYDGTYVVFGVQQAIIELIYIWNDTFFDRDLDFVLSNFKTTLENFIGEEQDVLENIKKLHNLGYLPITVKSIDEGENLPINIPCFTVETKEGFAWLFGYLEPQITSLTWKSITTATIAREYYRVGKLYGNLTCDNLNHLPFQFHDFGSRGMSGVDDAIRIGTSHLLAFNGTESFGALDYVEDIYEYDYDTEGCLASTIKATEHSVSTTNILYELGKGASDLKDAETRFLKRYINEIYPTGMVAYVADSFDFWGFMTEILPNVKQDILNRDGKLVIRPDSFDPVDGLCGSIDYIKIPEHVYDNEEDLEEWICNYVLDVIENETPHGVWGVSEYTCYSKHKDIVYKFELDISWGRYDKQYYYVDVVRLVNKSVYNPTPEDMGVIEYLYSIFGGTKNSKGFIELNPKIGVIYGDGINVERAEIILSKLKDKGFASSNIVIGLGGGTYQWISRDTLGIAYKTTNINTSDIGDVSVYKDPLGSNKKSAKGLICVKKKENGYIMEEDVSREKELATDMKILYSNGEFGNIKKFSEIRENFTKNN